MCQGAMLCLKLKILTTFSTSWVVNPHIWVALFVKAWTDRWIWKVGLVSWLLKSPNLTLLESMVFRVVMLHTSRRRLAGFLLELLFNPESGDITFLWNVTGLLPHYMALQPRRTMLFIVTAVTTSNLTPLDFYFWGYVEYYTCLKEVTSLKELKARTGKQLGMCDSKNNWVSLVGTKLPFQRT